MYMQVPGGAGGGGGYGRGRLPIQVQESAHVISLCPQTRGRWRRGKLLCDFSNYTKITNHLNVGGCAEVAETRASSTYLVGKGQVAELVSKFNRVSSMKERRIRTVQIPLSPQGRWRYLNACGCAVVAEAGAVASPGQVAWEGQVTMVKQLYRAEVWENLSPELVLCFWSLSLSDIHFPKARSPPPPPL